MSFGQLIITKFGNSYNYVSLYANEYIFSKLFECKGFTYKIEWLEVWLRKFRKKINPL